MCEATPTEPATRAIQGPRAPWRPTPRGSAPRHGRGTRDGITAHPDGPWFAWVEPMPHASIDFVSTLRPPLLERDLYIQLIICVELARFNFMLKIIKKVARSKFSDWDPKTIRKPKICLVFNLFLDPSQRITLGSARTVHESNLGQSSPTCKLTPKMRKRKLKYNPENYTQTYLSFSKHTARNGPVGRKSTVATPVI